MPNRSYVGCQFKWAGYWYLIESDRLGVIKARRLRYGRIVGNPLDTFKRSDVEVAEQDGDRFRPSQRFAVAKGK